jgi:hypothetical protein
LCDTIIVNVRDECTSVACIALPHVQNTSRLIVNSRSFTYREEIAAAQCAGNAWVRILLHPPNFMGECTKRCETHVAFLGAY